MRNPITTKPSSHPHPHSTFSSQSSSHHRATSLRNNSTSSTSTAGSTTTNTTSTHNSHNDHANRTVSYPCIEQPVRVTLSCNGHYLWGLKNGRLVAKKRRSPDKDEFRLEYEDVCGEQGRGVVSIRNHRYGGYISVRGSNDTFGWNNGGGGSGVAGGAVADGGNGTATAERETVSETEPDCQDEGLELELDRNRIDSDDVVDGYTDYRNHGNDSQDEEDVPIDRTDSNDSIPSNENFHDDDPPTSTHTSTKPTAIKCTTNTNNNNNNTNNNTRQTTPRHYDTPNDDRDDGNSPPPAKPPPPTSSSWSTPIPPQNRKWCFVRDTNSNRVSLMSIQSAELFGIDRKGNLVFATQPEADLYRKHGSVSFLWNIEVSTGELCFLCNPLLDRRVRCDLTGTVGLSANWKGWEVFRFIEAGDGYVKISSWMHAQWVLCSTADGEVTTCGHIAAVSVRGGDSREWKEDGDTERGGAGGGGGGGGVTARQRNNVTCCEWAIEKSSDRGVTIRSRLHRRVLGVVGNTLRTCRPRMTEQQLQQQEQQQEEERQRQRQRSNCSTDSTDDSDKLLANERIIQQLEDVENDFLMELSTHSIPPLSVDTTGAEEEEEEEGEEREEIGDYSQSSSNASATRIVSPKPENYTEDFDRIVSRHVEKSMHYQSKSSSSTSSSGGGGSYNGDEDHSTSGLSWQTTTTTTTVSSAVHSRYQTSTRPQSAPVVPSTSTSSVSNTGALSSNWWNNQLKDMLKNTSKTSKTSKTFRSKMFTAAGSGNFGNSSFGGTVVSPKNVTTKTTKNGPSPNNSNNNNNNNNNNTRAVAPNPLHQFTYQSYMQQRTTKPVNRFWNDGSKRNSTTVRRSNSRSPKHMEGFGGGGGVAAAAGGGGGAEGSGGGSGGDSGVPSKNLSPSHINGKTVVGVQRENVLWQLEAVHLQTYSICNVCAEGDNKPLSIGPFPSVTSNLNKTDKFRLVHNGNVTKLFNTENKQYIACTSQGEIVYCSNRFDKNVDWIMGKPAYQGGGTVFQSKLHNRYLSFRDCPKKLCNKDCKGPISLGLFQSKKDSSTNSAFHNTLCTTDTIGPREVWKLDPAMPRAVSSEKMFTFALGATVAVGTTVALPFALAGVGAVLGAVGAEMGVVANVVAAGLTGAEAIASVGAIGATAYVVFQPEKNEVGDGDGKEKLGEGSGGGEITEWSKRPFSNWKNW